MNADLALRMTALGIVALAAMVGFFLTHDRKALGFGVLAVLAILGMVA